MRKRVLCAVGLGGIIALAGFNVSAQEPKADNAPKTAETGPGALIPSSFRQFLVTDGRYPANDIRNRAGKVHCLVCENGLAPVVTIFVRADPDSLADSKVGELIRRTNDLIPKYRADKLASFVSFLRLGSGTKTVTVKSIGEDKTETETKVEQDLEYPDEPLEKREKAVESIRQLATALKTPYVPFGLAADKSKAAIQWGLSKEGDVEGGDAVTVVFYYRMRQVGKWEFKTVADLTDEKITEILKSVENAIKTTRR
jgi:hypothetical protein